ncbi:hypothetical protein C0J52_16123 [Blattella germanica]|nr:hypothetical protein C0J52_16123 [Blattella germanica]
MAPGLEGSTRGSRRIFAPQFKLQVLDSYRKDADCRGNQRATARKYGIHRRQIQKWLQVEASLRAAVPELAALNLARQRDDTAEATCQPETPHKAVRVSLFPNVRVEEDSDDEEPLDFTSATLSKRRSFSLQFKLEVLDAFHSDTACHGNQRATARKFGINRRQVQKWLGQEVELRGEAAFRGGLYRQRLGRGEADQCWDLSNKKRKAEPILEVPQIKKPKEDYQTDVQETALCLVKVERREEEAAMRPEVSSTMDKLPVTPPPPPFLLSPHTLHMGPFVPPPSLHVNMVNLYRGLVGECKVNRYEEYHRHPGHMLT